MNESAEPGALRPFLIRGKQGCLLALYHPPLRPHPFLGDVLVVQAFAEELNRCRAMVGLQARALAALGMGVLILDPHGAGDSAGEFEQASWDGWRHDMQMGVAWLREHGQGCRTLWGVRLGALMAAEIAQADAGIDRLLLWMPVVNGKIYWTQFLRIRIAAEMTLADGIKSTDLLRQQSARGEVVEASGYRVGSALARQLDQLQMPGSDGLVRKSVLWCETTTSADAAPPRASVKVIEGWRAGGAQVEMIQATGPSFWLAHDREVAPMLIDAGTAAVKHWAEAGSLPSETSAAAAEPVSVMSRQDAAEYPVVFPCAGQQISGVVHRGAPDATIGVVIVVAGGPQYRVGAHRQFVSLARLLAGNGYIVMRFDLRGMGDSTGQHQGFLHSRPDICSAVDALMLEQPGLREVALFGECNSASGILFYAWQDLRVRQIVLVNPWVRTPELQAETILKHYYLDRLKSREFWLHLRSGKFRFGDSLRSLAALMWTAALGRKQLRMGGAADRDEDLDRLPLPARTAEGLRRFKGRALFLLSGRDLIAREFDEVTKSSAAWEGLLGEQRVSREVVVDADHTFSTPVAKQRAQRLVLDWLLVGGLPGKRA